MQYKIHNQDCLVHLRSMADNSVDSIVTDPPYGLSFMGKKWDYDVPSVEIWAECLRVLKPGGHLLAFAGTRTQHRMAVRIEDAGFEIRDMIAWVYGSGFPKSHDVSKAIDKAAGAEREVVGSKLGLPGYHLHPHDGGEALGHGLSSSTYETRLASSQITAPATDSARQWQGWGTALKPALEPITVARKPLIGTVAENVLSHGTGALNIDGGRVGNETRTNAGMSSLGVMHDDEWKPRDVSSTVTGRWPANLIHDGSDEVVAGFPQTGVSNGGGMNRDGKNNHVYGTHTGHKKINNVGYGDEGSAARFFYCAKASKKDRDEGLDGFPVQINSNGDKWSDIDRRDGKVPTPRQNIHPTVKPTDLMRYLCRLVTPPGGVVLDPFMGSGSTGKAAVLEGFQFVGIERDAEYTKIAEARIQAAMPKPLQDGLNGTTADDIQQLSLL